MKINIQTVHFDADAKLLEFIEQKINKLEHYFDHIIDAEVILRLENSGQVRDKIAEVKMHVPGGTLMAKEIHPKAFEGAVDAATEAIRKQLIKFKEKQRTS
jgi:putative sigma-54 modulation protein